MVNYGFLTIPSPTHPPTHIPLLSSPPHPLSHAWIEDRKESLPALGGVVMQKPLAVGFCPAKHQTSDNNDPSIPPG